MTDTNRQEPPLPAATRAGAGAQTMLLGTELIRADEAARLGLYAPDTGALRAPGGGAVTWLLVVDGGRVACTDEPLTDQAAQDWARRLLAPSGEHVVFHPAGRVGGHWLAEGGWVS